MTAKIAHDPLMSYARAKFLVWNHESYSRRDVERAAFHILASSCARQQDVDQATSLTGVRREPVAAGRQALTSLRIANAYGEDE